MQLISYQWSRNNAHSSQHIRLYETFHKGNKLIFNQVLQLATSYAVFNLFILLQ